MNEKPVIKRCPVTFVKDKIVSDKDELNNIFIMPYELNMVSAINEAMAEDINKNMMFDISNKSGCEEDQNAICKRAMKYYGSDKSSFMSNIIAFLVMNITDLTYTTLIRFSSNYSINTNINIDSIRSIVTDSLISGLEINTIPINSSEEDSFLMFEKTNDYMIGHIVTKIFDKYIVDNLNPSVPDKLFIEVFEECYGPDSYVEDATTNLSPADRYVFVSSCLREKMQDYIVQFREALLMLATSAANMYANCPIYTVENYMNPDYTYKDIVKNNNEMTTLYTYLGLMEK